MILCLTCRLLNAELAAAMRTDNAEHASRLRDAVKRHQEACVQDTDEEV